MHHVVTAEWKNHSKGEVTGQFMQKVRTFLNLNVCRPKWVRFSIVFKDFHGKLARFSKFKKTGSYVVMLSHVFHARHPMTSCNMGTYFRIKTFQRSGLQLSTVLLSTGIYCWWLGDRWWLVSSKLMHPWRVGGARLCLDAGFRKDRKNT